MTMLRLTDAGRAAMMDGTNRATNAVQLRSMQIGDGLGPGGAADDSRAALRSELESETLAGTSTVSGRLAVRADFDPASDFDVTEAGLTARIGDDGDEFLFAYWVVSSASSKLAAAVTGVTLTVAAVIDVTNSAAEVTVTVTPNLTLTPTTFVSLTDVPALITGDRYLRGNNTGDGLVFAEAPPVVATEGDLPSAAAAVASTYVVLNYNSTDRPVLALLAGGAWRYLYVPGNFPAATTAAAGILRLATLTQAAARTDTTLAVPPAGVAAAIASASLAAVELYYNEDGLDLATAVPGTSVTLSEGLSGFRYVELCIRQTSPATAPAGKFGMAGIRSSTRVIVADIPAARTFAYQLNVSDSSTVRVWQSNDTTLVLEGGGATDALHAVIGYRT